MTISQTKIEAAAHSLMNLKKHRHKILMSYRVKSYREIVIDLLNNKNPSSILFYDDLIESANLLKYNFEIPRNYQYFGESISKIKQTNLTQMQKEISEAYNKYILP